MTPKERVIAALTHQQPDRVPTGENQVDGHIVEQVLGHPSLYNAGWREFEALWSGQRDALVADYGEAHIELTQKLRWDYVRVPAVPPAGEHKKPQMTGPNSWLDATGREVTVNPDVGSIAAVSSTPDMTIFELPDPGAPGTVDGTQLEAVRHVANALGDSHFIIARSPVDGTFPWEDTVGMEEFLVRMITEPAFVHQAIDAYVSRSLIWIEAMLEAGAHAVMTTDDYSDNRGPIMGAARFRQFILPGLRRQCECCHDLGGYFIKHTDGNTWEILDDFVDIGIDGWHGIQPGIGMDFKRLKQRYGGQLCLFGGVDCDTLINGPAERAREQVRYAIEHASSGGGLVIATSNVLQPGTQLENYLAMRQAVDDFGDDSGG